MTHTVRLIDLRPGDAVSVTGEARIEVVHKSGRVTRLRITAPPEVVIWQHGGLANDALMRELVKSESRMPQ
jgi:NMD protein affecting ribosome stability and mRNA decay